MVKSVAIVSLSRGILGEAFIKHELKIGLNRLEFECRSRHTKMYHSFWRSGDGGC